MSEQQDQENIISLKGMYKEYFLDYASYVILERAVPAIYDGFKPVQRRILYSLKEKDDGRYHKVANLIGHTMQYHPHGDQSIGDALVNLGQKNLLIDCQGNWGDSRTGDSAAAPRYIEARLTKFALDVVFNEDTTVWQLSYDGRNKEPVFLPVKFPLVLSLGVDGIAVGLSTKILPHNFIELIEASILHLEGKSFTLYPDFETGGFIDVSDYQKGKRGGKVKVRAKIDIVDKKSLAIREIPYSTTTMSIIDSIIKANDKGTIKIKKVIDNTAKNVEIFIELAPNISPEVTMDALYAFTQCEVSISPNACVIIEDKPHFLTVDEILRFSTDYTKELLRQELVIDLKDLQEKWHFASLEKIFIENRIYRDIEDCESWEEVIKAVDTGLKKYIITPSTPPEERTGNKIALIRDINDDDITRLTEIRIKRISKYNSFKADEQLKSLEDNIATTKHHLDHLTIYAIDYFKRLLEKYGKGRERKTEITTLGTIDRTEVMANNCKLYVNREEGFVGWGLKKDEFIKDCSEIDDIIVFRKDGCFQVVKISDKVFVGKDIMHVDVWKKGDERTTYNLVYLDGTSGKTFAKRFNVTSITREKDYDTTQGTPRTKILYFAVHPNGEAEMISVQLTQASSARKKLFEFNFSDLEIKGRSSKGNTLTKYPVRKITQLSVGKSTLGRQEIWYDNITGKLNKDQRGKSLGKFDTGDTILVIYKNGNYIVTDFDLLHKYDNKNIEIITQLKKESIINAIYFDGEKQSTFVKRFMIETTSLGQEFCFISDSNGSKLYFVSLQSEGEVHYKYRKENQNFEKNIIFEDFIDVKGWKAMGNKLIDAPITNVSQAMLENESDENEDIIDSDVPNLNIEDSKDFGSGEQAGLFD